MKAGLTWKEGLTFESDIRHHRITMDTSGMGGKDLGPSPKELLLSSIIGCTAMDVISLLKKYRIDVESFKMSAEAHTTESYPKIFPQIDMIYDLVIRDYQPEVHDKHAIEAVELSMTKYCGVSAMVNETSPIFYTLRINGQIQFRDQARFPKRVS